MAAQRPATSLPRFARGRPYPAATHLPAWSGQVRVIMDDGGVSPLDGEEPPFVRYSLQHVGPALGNSDVRADEVQLHSL